MSKSDLPGPLLAGPAPRKQRSRRRMTPLRRVLYGLAAPVALALFRLLWSTYRFTVIGGERIAGLVEDGSPLILTFWHDRIYTIGWYLRQLVRRGVAVTYLVSPSVDGELAVRLLNLMRSHVVRGSATRSGVKAMRDLYRVIVRIKASPVILPDGPQGPRHHCKPGSLLLAQMSGAPVVPMASAARRTWRLHTWDRLQVPLPFTRVAIVIGEPYTVPKGLDADQLEEYRQVLEQQLQTLVQEAETRAGQAGG